MAFQDFIEYAKEIRLISGNSYDPNTILSYTNAAYPRLSSLYSWDAKQRLNRKRMEIACQNW